MYERIVCLTEETTETLYSIGEDWRIVGISGFTVRPLRARREKPRVSAFTTAKIDEIRDLRPDLVLGFSDIQADIAAELIGHGIEVHVFNHRSVDGILRMIRTLGAMVGCAEKGEQLAAQLSANLTRVQERARGFPGRPRIYFEEWSDPLISGIRWVSELLGYAGGEDCFPELSESSLAKGRIIEDPQEVVRRAPDIIIGSWCGRKFRPEKVLSRPGWENVPAIRHGHVYEIKSSIILQPGPAALTEGVAAIQKLIERWTSLVRPGRGWPSGSGVGRASLP